MESWGRGRPFVHTKLLMHKKGMSRSGEIRQNMEESACL